MHNLTNSRSFIALTVLISILPTGMNMLLVSNTMSGMTDFKELSIHTIKAVIEETDVGISWVVRLFALLITPGGLFLYTKNRVLSCLLMTINGAVALTTLTWGGHAVVHDGVHYYPHLFSDLTHLGAAGTWAGALATFAVLLVRKDNHNARSVSIISDSLVRLVMAGTVIVVALSLSVLVSYLCIAKGELAPLFNSAWESILPTKTTLLVLTFLLTAANRFYLGPRPEVMIREGNYVRSVVLMRDSILTEFIIAVTILGAVSWLGVLAPPQAS